MKLSPQPPITTRASVSAGAVRAAVAGVALAALSCGGGTDGTGSVRDGVTSTGVMTRGSVILNGIRFDAAGAQVTDDRGRGEAQLATGMVIKLRGRSENGTTGSADRVDVENELRAAISSIDGAADPQRIVVAGRTVAVDSTTVYANVAGFGALTAGMRVEVHGLRDADGWLRAARIEAVGAAGLDEVRGRVIALDTASNRFTVEGNVIVTYAGATFAPAGAGAGSLAIGTQVEVRGTLATGSAFGAVQVDIEDLEDAAYAGAIDERQDVEGFVTGFVAHPGEFRVNGRRVRTSADTRFAAGAADDLVDNVQVEVEGTIDAQGVLVASHVKFRRTRIVLQGRATSVDPVARTVALLGRVVHTNDVTRFVGGPQLGLGDILPGVHCVDVRGYADGARLVADRVRRQPACTRDIVQARVSAKNQTTLTLTFFDALAAVSLPGTLYFDENELPLSADAFFARVVPADSTSIGSLVRVRGTWAAAVFAVEQADLKE